jgi:hypothetical protein
MAIVVDITARLGRSMPALKKLESVLSSINDRIDRLVQGLDRAANASQRISVPRLGAPGARGSASGAPRAATWMDAIAYAKGINAMSGGRHKQMVTATAQRAMAHYLPRAQSGDPAAMRAVGRLGQMLKPGKGIGQLALDAVMTSRVGMGGGMMPLVGRLVPLLLKLGPAGIIAAAGLIGVNKALKAVAEAVRVFDESAARINSTAQRSAAAGGTLGQASAMKTLERVLGSDPSQAFRETGDGLAMAEMARAGINPIRGPYGDINSSGAALKYMQKRIWSASSYEEAQRRAAQVGSPELAGAYFLKNDERLKTRLVNKTGHSEADAANAARAQAWLGEMESSWQRFIDKVVIKAAPVVVPALEKITAFIDLFVTGLESISARLQSWWASLPEEVRGPLETLWDMTIPGMLTNADRAVQRASNVDAINRALSANTRATQDNTRALSGLREVIGSVRAGRSVPSKVWGGGLSDAAYRAALEGGVL